jgi:hypothetical protein
MQNASSPRLSRLFYCFQFGMDVREVSCECVDVAALASVGTEDADLATPLLPCASVWEAASEDRCEECATG